MEVFFMKLYKVWTLFCCLLLAFAFIAGCGSDEEEDEHDDHDHDEAFNASTMLNDFANTVVLATYTELDNKAGRPVGSRQGTGIRYLASES